MRRVCRPFLILALLFYGCAWLTPASAEEKNVVEDSGKLKYEFNDIKVLYAAEFLAYPEQAPQSKETVMNSVYGDLEPIHVLYGEVSLGGGTWKEEFIKVSQGDAFTRGLSNSMSWDNFGMGSGDKIVSTEFVTGKTLEGTSVVKDYSQGWKVIKLTRNLDNFGIMKEMSISFKWDLVGAYDSFFEKLTATVYKVDMSSLKSVGQQVTGP